MDDRYRSRKFMLAAAFTISSIVAVFTAVISGGEYLGAMGLILGLYGASNVAGAKVK